MDKATTKSDLMKYQINSLIKDTGADRLKFLL
ncbi:MAG: hypothetical protein A4E53_00524 [Pelotomaculum sp. PtaB.Bin104]|nr:MAG: hypothetical protein A4E53_00524 [Pelotomaculum sp. PtaB.Bin104]